MRLRVTSQINAGGSDPLFVMFHGYGNDESEMVRIIDAVYADHAANDVDHAAHVAAGADDAATETDSVDDAEPAESSAESAIEPSYLSFRGTYDRPYMGGTYWYPDGCSIEERRRECSAVGEAVTQLLDSPMFAHRKKVLVGFSQGGYLSYRMVKAYPDLFDAAVLLNPSFKGEEAARLDSSTRFFLAYGSNDHTIPLLDQCTARQVLDDAGHLEYHGYPGMGHAICDEEIRDIRAFVWSL
ncbi:dienelactone hydrolase family protein [Bifidobacterium sp. SO4]|uniref:alpha/beta hydrolase n=1 Tax=Bifidobacterium sp. SO4 TaxID=2809030 RepID=UPI001BDD2A67|nr:dienelactone hydrolase family protein [Bifidobacterium sp. SO4]MBT1170333.1 dienelactone hydrolase family protein [Bifidobacterium sp. SO4]